LERAFLGRCGFTRENDKVSKAHYGRLQPKGKPMPELGFTEAELEKMKDDYYQLREWDVKTGMPTKETLEKYGLVNDIEEKT
jgi:aldehyde:ferredoxin oxidoreductase